jgi:hypothetical protein
MALKTETKTQPAFLILLEAELDREVSLMNLGQKII